MIAEGGLDKEDSYHHKPLMTQQKAFFNDKGDLSALCKCLTRVHLFFAR